MKLPRLKEVRELHGWSQAKLAEESDVSRDSISNYETGHREAWPSTAKKLADTLGVEIVDLVARAEEPVPLGEGPPPSRPKDEETPGKLIHAEVLDKIASLWAEQLSRGLYDETTLGQMYMTGGLLMMNHDATIGEDRENLRPDFLEQLKVAEEHFLAVDSQIWEALEKASRGHAPPPDELAAKREARRKELRGGRHARHA